MRRLSARRRRVTKYRIAKVTAFPKVAITACLASVCLSPIQAYASEYDALCNGVECKIMLDAKGVSGPGGFIPAHRIAQWYTGGGEERNGTVAAVGATGGAVGGVLVGGLATCWTIILCPIGLIAGGVAGGMGGAQAGKSADFYYTIIGYNQEGKKVLQSFNFLNKKPANKMAQELPVVTGLGMGEMRNIAEIKAGDAREASTGSGREALPGSINSVASNAQSAKSLPSSLNEVDSATSVAKSDGAKCWSTFLARPGMTAWADKNKKQALSLKAKYQDC